MKTGRTILDLEHSLQNALKHTLASFANSPEADALRLLIPDGYSAAVTLRSATGRRKNRNASAGTWSPESGEIVVHCTPNSGESPSESNVLSAAPPVKEFRASSNRAMASRSTAPSKNAASVADSKSEQIRELCGVLAETERAGRSFIALKWFRDDVLAGKSFSWAQSAEGRQAVLANAIEQGALVTKKILNPRAPQFPTTTIALSRSYSAAQTPEQHRYAPVPVKGEPLSATLLRDRGAR